MLGDEEEKKPGNSLNPLKRAMQRRNTKTVQFTAPSYVEPSDIEYSSEEEEGNEEYVGQEDEGVTAQSHDQGKDLDDSAAVEPHKAKGQARDGQQNGEAIVDQRMRDEGSDQGSIADKPRTSDETFERNGRATQIDPTGQSSADYRRRWHCWQIKERHGTKYRLILQGRHCRNTKDQPYA